VLHLTALVNYEVQQI